MSGEWGLTWYGQSCFAVAHGGFRVVMDPIPPHLGYPPLQVAADLVTVSHEHGDHNYVAGVGGQPLVLRGLTEGGRDWALIDQQVGPLRVRSLPSYHDDMQGSRRGRNAIFVFEWDGLRLVHLGDLGHLLEAGAAAAIGQVDLLFVPVGGHFTIDAAQAQAVVEQLRPAVAIPMHYRTPAVGERLPIATEEAFLAGQPRVKRWGSTVAFAAGQLPPEREIWVLAPPGA